MSRRKARHLAPVPDAPKGGEAVVGFPQQVEIPLGTERRPVTFQLTVLSLVAGIFPDRVLHGFEVDRVRNRLVLTCVPTDTFTASDMAQARAKVVRALVALGQIEVKKPAPAADATAEKPPEDGAQSPVPPSQPS